MVRTYFSIASAESLLPSLSLLVKEAQLLKRRLERYEQHKITTDGEVEVDFSEDLDAEHQGLKQQFYDKVERIEARGCVLRSLEEGVIDFYTRFEGRDVFLSWRIGEREVRHWHETDEDFSSRKPIIEMK
jgi:hypothetical protein